MTTDPSHEAKAFLSLLWGHIYARVQAMIHPHHIQHEPGGNDEVRLPLGFLKDVSINSAVDGNALVKSGDLWVPGAGGGAGGIGQAFFEMFGSLYIATVPGPTNLTGSTLTITRVLIASDGACTGTAAGQAFSFGAGGGTDDNTGLSSSWADGSAISATISSAGTDGSYLTVDVYFTS